MYINYSQCRKARVIRDTVLPNGSVKRETIIEGIACRFTDLGAFIYNPKEQAGIPTWAEFFPYKAPCGTKTILYL